MAVALSDPSVTVQKTATMVDMEVDLRVAEMTMKGFRVTPQGGNFYLIADVPCAFVESFGYMDVVELEPSADDVFELKRVVASGGWRRFEFIVGRDVFESQGMASLLARVDSSGGAWVREMGLLYILLPPGSTWDPRAEVAVIADEVRAGSKPRPSP